MFCDLFPQSFESLGRKTHPLLGAMRVSTSLLLRQFGGLLVHLLRRLGAAEANSVRMPFTFR